jgi:uncharacterized membrane protein
MTTTSTSKLGESLGRYRFHVSKSTATSMHNSLPPRFPPLHTLNRYAVHIHNGSQYTHRLENADQDLREHIRRKTTPLNDTLLIQSQGHPQEAEYERLAYIYAFTAAITVANIYVASRLHNYRSARKGLTFKFATIYVIAYGEMGRITMTEHQKGLLQLITIHKDKKKGHAKYIKELATLERRLYNLLCISKYEV